jgi:hypothetical protein
MTWMGAAVPVGDEVFFYYGGYARGHKIAPATERQIGLARMGTDRYVGMVSNRGEGVLLTRPFLMLGERLTMNARADKGQVAARILDEESRPLHELGEPITSPVRGDVLAGAVRWRMPLDVIRGRPVRLEFRVRDAALFGFSLAGKR